MLDGDGRTAWHAVRMMDKDGLDEKEFDMVEHLMEMLDCFKTDYLLDSVSSASSASSN